MLRKPYDVDELIAAVQALCDGETGRSDGLLTAAAGPRYGQRQVFAVTFWSRRDSPSATTAFPSAR